jgi:hypothetical protein
LLKAEGGTFAIRVTEDKLTRERVRLPRGRRERARGPSGVRALTQIKRQTGIRRLRGKVIWEGSLDEMRGGGTSGGSPEGLSGSVRTR